MITAVGNLCQCWPSYLWRILSLSPTWSISDATSCHSLRFCCCQQQAEISTAPPVLSWGSFRLLWGALYIFPSRHFTVFLALLWHSSFLILRHRVFEVRLHRAEQSLSLFAVLGLMHTKLHLALLTDGTHCWLLFYLSSVGTTRSFSTGFFSFYLEKA